MVDADIQMLDDQLSGKWQRNMAAHARE